MPKIQERPDCTPGAQAQQLSVRAIELVYDRLADDDPNEVSHETAENHRSVCPPAGDPFSVFQCPLGSSNGRLQNEKVDQHNRSVSDLVHDFTSKYSFGLRRHLHLQQRAQFSSMSFRRGAELHP